VGYEKQTQAPTLPPSDEGFYHIVPSEALSSVHTLKFKLAR